MYKTYTWQQGIDFATMANNQNLCGATDWRMPTKDELLGIVKSDSASKIDTSYFPNTIQSLFWSSTSYIYGDYAAWLINFNSGSSVGNDKTDAYHIRLVHD